MLCIMPCHMSTTQHSVAHLKSVYVMRDNAIVASSCIMSSGSSFVHWLV